MLRGVSKRVIEVKRLENNYFERVYFIVREGQGAYPEGLLRAQADAYLRQAGILGRRRADRRTVVRRLLLAAVYFAAAAAGVWTALKLFPGAF